MICSDNQISTVFEITKTITNSGGSKKAVKEKVSQEITRICRIARVEPRQLVEGWLGHGKLSENSVYSVEASWYIYFPWQTHATRMS